MRNPSDKSGGAGAGKSTPCCSKVGLKRGPWTPEEDQILADFIGREGQGRWRTLPKRAGLLRCGKSCRLRWMNYLRPSVKRGQIAADEEDLILRLHRLLGNRWSLIAGRIPGRTDNEIKNYWNTHLSKKLISQGIDPRTHKPLDLNTPIHKSKNIHKADLALPSQNPNQLQIESQEEEEGGWDSHKEAPAFPSGAAAFSFDPMGHSSPKVAGGVEDEDCMDPTYCTEDVFSSFLNSLINEDLYTCTQNQQQQQQQQQMMMIPHYDALVGQPPNSSAAWEAPPMASSTVAATPPDVHRGHA